MKAAVSVLIAGAGPTGLALACDLARRGVSFRIVDKSPTYFAGSRGKGLQPRSLEVFDDFGVVDQILANGRFHLPFRAYQGSQILGDRDIHEDRFPTPDVPYASVLIIPQWRVESILRGLLEQSGGRVESGTELVDFEQTDESVVATLDRAGEREHVTAEYLVGADGGHSFVRKALGVGFEGETWPTERMLVGDVQVDGLDRDHWHSWADAERGWLALCPLPSTNAFQFQAQIGADEGEDPSLDRFREIVEERTGGLDIRLHDPTWLSLYRPNVRMVDKYRVGRVFLAGDSAHVHSPAGGQGMNTGIQDAYNLGWKLALAANGAPGRLLDTYEEERLPVAAWMLGVTTKLHREILPKEGFLARRGAETLQLGISYRNASLAKDLRQAAGQVRAGDRAPDAPCARPDGSAVRLFDLFRGAHFTLLGFGHGPESEEITDRPIETHVHSIVAPNSAAAANEIIDSDGHAKSAYDVPDGTLVLVRPDGYIGIITEGSSATGIRSYLRDLAGA